MSLSNTALQNGTSTQTSTATITSRESTLSNGTAGSQTERSVQTQRVYAASAASRPPSVQSSIVEATPPVSRTAPPLFSGSLTARMQTQKAPPQSKISPISRSNRVHTHKITQAIGSFTSPPTHSPVKEMSIPSSLPRLLFLPPSAVNQNSFSASSSMSSSSSAPSSNTATTTICQEINFNAENFVWGQVMDIWAQYYVAIKTFDSYEAAYAYLNKNLDTQTITIPDSTIVSDALSKQKCIQWCSSKDIILNDFASHTFTLNEFCLRIIRVTKVLSKLYELSPLNTEALAIGLAATLTEAALQNP